MDSKPAIQLVLFEVDPKNRKQSRTERSTDSEGRYTIEVNIPDKKIFIEAQQRRKESIAKRLRRDHEEIRQLKAELNKLRSQYGLQ